MHRGTLRLSSAAPLLVASVIAVGGCSVARPSVRATAATIGTRGTGTSQVDVTIALENTGSTEVELVTYDYIIKLADGSSYGGRWAALRALPPGQTVEAKIPAVLPVASAVEGARWDFTGTVSYRDPQSFARILYEAGLLKTEAQIEGSGSLVSARKPGN
jgi:hypothetical protein